MGRVSEIEVLHLELECFFFFVKQKKKNVFASRVFIGTAATAILVWTQGSR